MMNIKKSAGYSALLMLLAACNLTVPAEAAETEYPWIYEAFEDVTAGSATADGATLTAVDDGAYGSNGALKVSVSGNITNGSGGYKIDTKLQEGKTYKFSFYSKLEDGANIPRDDSGNGNYNSDGDISKIYAVFHSGGSIVQTTELTDFVWSNEGYAYFEQEIVYEGADCDATLSLRVGERSDRGGWKLQGGSSLVYYLDEFKLIPVSEDTLVTEINYCYPENESNMIEISYDFTGEENNSLCVFMVENDGNWITHDILQTGADSYMLEIPSTINGKRCKFVLYPADGTRAGCETETVIDEIKLNIIENFEISDDVITANVDLCYDTQKQVMVIVCQYSAENEMLAVEYENAECSDGITKTVDITSELKENTTTARLFIWEGVDFKTSSMASLTDEMVIEK